MRAVPQPPEEPSVPPSDPDSQLTPLQVDLMRVLWGRKEASVAEVQAALAPERRLALTTVATILQRLEKRGVVTHRKAGRQFIYRAVIGEDEARAAMVAELAERLFEGDAAQLVHHLIASRHVRPGDLARVRAMIEDHEKEGKSDRETR